MNRIDAKKIILLLSVYAQASRQEQLLIIDELLNGKALNDQIVLSNNEAQFIYLLENAAHSLLYDLHQLVKAPVKDKCTISDDFVSLD